jgi:murein DD-endopeptidase MepM/ murein hydrolase activator NlpD
MPNVGTPAWTLIIVPPNAMSSTKRVGFKMRWFRLAGMLMLTVVTLTWIWMEAEDRLRESITARLVAEQQTTLALRDTLQSMRSASLAERVRNSPPADMLMPVHAAITSSFARSRFHPILQMFRAHKGVDLGAPMGTRIQAPAPGTVVSAGWRIGYGLVIELAHSGGVVTRYAHCRTTLVKAGDKVEKGQAIGLVGATGLATAPHLHFEVLVKGNQVDPIKFISASHSMPDLSAPVTHAGHP